MIDKIRRLLRPTPEPEDLTQSGMTTFMPQYEATDRDTPDVQLTMRLAHDYVGQSYDWVLQAQENMLFWEGDQWTEDEQHKLEKKKQIPAVIPVTYQVVEQAQAMLAANSPEFRVTGREDSDTKDAALRSAILQWIWQYSEQNGLNFKSAIRDYYVQGRGVIKVYIDIDADMGQGEVCIKDIDPQNVFVSPNSQDRLWDDADHILVRTWMTRSNIMDMYPGVDVSNIQHGPITNQMPYRGGAGGHITSMSVVDHQSAEDPPYEVWERFTKVKRKFYRLHDPQNPMVTELLNEESFMARIQMTAFVLETENQDIVVFKAPDEVGQMEQLFLSMGGDPDMEGDATVQFHYVQQPDQVGPNGEVVPGQPVPMPGPSSPNAIPGSRQWLTKTTIERLLETTLLYHVEFLHTRVRVTCCIGNQELHPGYDLPTQHYPIVPMMDNHKRTPFTTSAISKVRDLQRIINKTMSLLLAHVANSANVKVFYPQSGMTDMQTFMEAFAQAGTAMIPYQPEPGLGATGGINVVHPAPLNAGLFGFLDWLRAQIEQTCGIYSLQQGDPVSAPETYRGTLAIDEYGTRRINNKKKDIYHSLSRAGKICLDMASDIYEDGKVIRLANPNGESQIFELMNFTQQIKGFEDQFKNEYDVIVLGGSTLPSNRWALAQLYMEYFQMGIVDDEAVLKASELPDAENILKRKGMLQQMMQQTEQLTQMLEQMQKQMAQLAQEKQGLEQNQAMIELQKEIEMVIERMQNYEAQYQELRNKEMQHHKALLAKDRQIAIAQQKNRSTTR